MCQYRQKDQYDVKWFIPLVELSLEDRLLSPGLLLVFRESVAGFVAVEVASCDVALKSYL